MLLFLSTVNVYILYYLKHEEDNNYDGSNSNSGVTPVNYRGSGHRRVKLIVLDIDIY